MTRASTSRRVLRLIVARSFALAIGQVAYCGVDCVRESNRLPGAVYKYRALRRPQGDLADETDPQGSVSEHLFMADGLLASGPKR